MLEEHFVMVALFLFQRNQQKRHEKILKELEKRYEMEQNKNAKLTEAQKLKDEELKTIQKVILCLSWFLFVCIWPPPPPPTFISLFVSVF